MPKKTLVLGASANPARYSYLAMRQLQANGHEVVAIGRRPGEVNGILIETAPRKIDDIDTVTLYLNPANQKQYYSYILSLRPKRLIFNPGTENEELARMAREQGIRPLEACTLVLLSTRQY
ncbi:MAG TPA: CoA-binding protein [Parasegetibacter sp.]